MNIKDNIWSKSLPYAMYVMGILLPFNQPAANYALGLFSVIFVIVVLQNLKTCKFNLQLLLLPVLFFALHITGILYSSELKIAFNDIGTKSAFLILPLLFSSGIIPSAKFQNFKTAFIAGCLIVCLYNLSLSCYDYYRNGNSNVFYYILFSRPCTFSILPFT